MHSSVLVSIVYTYIVFLVSQINHSMFSCGRSIQLCLRHNIRPLCTQSQRSTPSSSSLSSFGGFGHNGDNNLEWFLRSITSGVVVVGSTLGYWYWSSLSSPAFADYNATEEQLQQNSQNRSKFLFNGNLMHLYIACGLKPLMTHV